jgi:hypothetical protein
MLLQAQLSRPPAFVFGAKSHKRLLFATDLITYYDAIGSDYTAANLQWTNVMRNFEIQWKALKVKQKEDPPETPKISKTLPVIKWTESFRDFLNRVIGVRAIPLCYVIRETVNVSAAATANQPLSNEHESVTGELVARASHEHALFRDDNAAVYHYLEEATRSPAYAASIKPFQRSKDGRGTWLALLGQYAGNDKREAEIKIQEADTSELGRVNATSRSNPISPSTGTPTYLWRPVLRTFSINSIFKGWLHT